jgi:YbbR domain-containing protein
MRRFWGERQLYSLLSVGIAMVMWLYVATAQNPVVSRPMRVDLQLRNLAQTEVVIRPAPSAPPVQVTVRLEGPRSQIALLTPKLVDAYADLSGLGPGDHPQVPIGVTPALDVKVVDVKPASILVVLDAFASKRIPVEVSLLGSPPEGVTLGGAHLAPSHVIVSGPAMQVEEVRHAYVSVDTASLRQQVIKSLPVIPADANGQAVPGVQVSPKLVGITLAVREGVVSKVVPVVPTITGAAPQALTVTGAAADPETVTLTGPAATLLGIENATTVPVDLSGARGDISRRVALQLPPGVTPSARLVTVTVRFGKGLLSTVLRAVPVRVVGAPVGATSRVVPDRVDVQVEGPQELIRRLNAQAVSVEVSAAGRHPGQYTMNPQAILPKGVHVLTIQPSQVVVIVSSS